MPDDLVISGFPVWHQWPREGSARRLGVVRHRHRPFDHEGVYTKEQISGYCWTDRRRVVARWESLPDDAKFLCELNRAGATFTLLPEDDDPLVDAGAAQAAVLELRSAGWSLRRIAQASEVSYDAVGRLAVGQARRRVRASTETAVLGLAAAAAANGKRSFIAGPPPSIRFTSDN